MEYTAEYITARICMTRDIGTHGNLFGGIMMAWIDEAASIFARRKTGEANLVTLRFSEILFRKPVHVSDMVEFYACCVKPGRTSISFDLLGKVKNKEIIRTNCTFVAVDQDGKPKNIVVFQK